MIYYSQIFFKTVILFFDNFIVLLFQQPFKF